MTDSTQWNARTQALLGEEAVRRLSAARVAVIGLGGVGGACAESLARAGIGTLILMDPDRVDITNLNRQNFALLDTVGMPKTLAAEKRLRMTAPALRLEPLPEFYEEATCELLFAQNPQIVVDAIDTVTSKLHLAAECRARQIPLIQCLGTGNRLDPSAFRLGTIEDTAGCGCGLARVMRRELKRRGISGQPVLYSLEIPRTVPAMGDAEKGRHPPASISFCPPAAGHLLASWTVRVLLGELPSTGKSRKIPQ